MNQVEALVDSDKWERMIYSIIRQKSFMSVCQKSTLITLEDMMQEGWAALLGAAERYDPDKEDGCKFSTWAWLAIFGAIRRYVERAIERELPDGGCDPSILQGQSTDPAETAESHDLWEQIHSMVTPDEAKMLYMRYVEGKSLREVSSVLGVSHQCVENRCRALKKRVDERLNYE